MCPACETPNPTAAAGGTNFLISLDPSETVTFGSIGTSDSDSSGGSGGFVFGGTDSNSAFPQFGGGSGFSLDSGGVSFGNDANAGAASSAFELPSTGFTFNSEASGGFSGFSFNPSSNESPAPPSPQAPSVAPSSSEPASKPTNALSSLLMKVSPYYVWWCDWSDGVVSEGR